MEIVAGLLIVVLIAASLAIGLGVVALIWREKLQEKGLSWEDGERAARKDRPR